MDIIEIRNLTKTYGKDNSRITALDGASFDLFFKELTIILGPSGSGKSTLLNILGGMDSASGGSVSVAGKKLSELKEKELTAYRRNDIGFVFQFYNLMPNLTALENVQLCESGLSTLTAPEALMLVGLGHRLRNFPGQLSGGEQQRVSIARAIVKNPKLLLCDEPTGALDTKTGKQILILLQKIARERQSAVVVVTHNVKLALAADRIIRLSDGKVVENAAQQATNAENIDLG